MKAEVGDRLVVEGDLTRTGLVVGLSNTDGSPPYVIRWQADGHIALVFPGPYSRIIPAGQSCTDRQGAQVSPGATAGG